jgi:hypothetical protein
MNDNPYEAPPEPPVSNEQSQGFSAITLWRVGRFFVLFGVILSAACFLPVLILDHYSQGYVGIFVAVVSAGLACGIAATIIGAFLLLLGDVLTRRSISQDPSRRPQIGHWFSVATFWMCRAAVGIIVFAPAWYAVRSYEPPEQVFQREMTISVLHAICVLAAVMLGIYVVGRLLR